MDQELKDHYTSLDRRIFALELVVRGEDGRNGIRGQLNALCQRFEEFERKTLKVVAIATAVPGVVAATIAALQVLGVL